MNNRRNNSHKLQNKWTIYIHNIKDTDWTLESYKKVMDIYTIEDFWVFFNNVNKFNNFLFFFMKDNIKPIYEDPCNKEGGSYSYILPGKHVNKIFIESLVRLISCNITDDSGYNEITGISLTPKNGFSVLRVWIRNKNKKIDIDLKNYCMKTCRYQNHKF
jgi:hypothetical protein